jgi:hypothetical protein
LAATRTTHRVCSNVVEALDWPQALMTLDHLELDPETIDDTLSTLVSLR